MRKIITIFAIMFAFCVSNAQIVADFTWTAPQCAGGTIVFTDASTGSPAISWEWRVGGNLLSTSPTFSYTFPLVSTPTDFQVSLFVTASPYSSNITKTVTIYPLPDIAISPINPTICEGSSVTLTASGATTYEWSTTATGSSINVSPASNTTYTVTVTDNNQCQNTASVLVAVNPTYFFPETHTMCDGETYTWQGTTYSTAGTYTASYQTSAGCDSIYELILTVNPVYMINQTHQMCDGEVYSWQGTDYSTTGVYTTSYTTIHGCDSIYELELTVRPVYEFITNESVCAGDSLQWRGQWYDVEDTYTESFTTIYGCDSTYVLNLTVNPLPQQVVVLQNPSNGVLQSGNSGQISLSTSVVDSKYWVTMGGATFTNDINGTGAGLNLGNNYPAGSFNVWSKTQADCQLLQGTVNFVENSGSNKIVANVTFGTPASNFPANHSKVVLYKKTTDIESNEVIVFEAEQMLGNNGQAEFNNLQPGDYYLGSFIQYPDNYNVAPHIYYQTAVVHEDAISIPVVAGTVFIASLHHVQFPPVNGSNNCGGTVGTNDKTFAPKKDMVVVLRDMDAQEIIGVSVTDINGVYAFENIPNNKNIQLFVTSFVHQNWIPYSVQTGNSQNYQVNFIIDGNSVYPEGTTDIEKIEVSKVDFKIFPNPAKDKILINTDCEKGIVRIYDMIGKLLQTEMIFKTGEINVSSLTTGTYLIVFTNDKGEAGVLKMVKE